MNRDNVSCESLNNLSFSIQRNISLSDKNWFKTGGNANYYCQPITVQDFSQAISFAKKHNLDIFVLGQGANVLISDDGFDGLVIHPKLQLISHKIIDDKTAHVSAQAGVIFNDLIEYCLNNKLINLEEFGGIPGTVGGSVYINIHYYEFFLSDFLVEATVINRTTGDIETVQKSWFEFGYDVSRLHNKDYFLVSATFITKCATGDQISYARGRKVEITRHREKRFPTKNTCGSFFRNFLQEEVQNTDKKLIYVAYYLDKIGVKGELYVGDAIVSHQHANMLINRGKATSSNIIELALLMQTMVKDRFGIIPQAECQLIGFKKNPLL